jgi:hypothetical protein
MQQIHELLKEVRWWVAIRIKIYALVHLNIN